MASAFSEDNTNIEMDDIDPEDDSEEEITSAQVCFSQNILYPPQLTKQYLF